MLKGGNDKLCLLNFPTCFSSPGESSALLQIANRFLNGFELRLLDYFPHIGCRLGPENANRLVGTKGEIPAGLMIWLSCVLSERVLPVRGEALKERLEFALFDRSGEAKCLCTLAK